VYTSHSANTSCVLQWAADCRSGYAAQVPAELYNFSALEERSNWCSATELRERTNKKSASEAQRASAANRPDCRSGYAAQVPAELYNFSALEECSIGVALPN
jgi:hypothetical protein